MMLKQHSGGYVLMNVKKVIQMVVGITLTRGLLRHLYGTAEKKKKKNGTNLAFVTTVVRHRRTIAVQIPYIVVNRRKG